MPQSQAPLEAAATRPREVTYRPEMEELIGGLSAHNSTNHGIVQAPSMDTRCWQEKHTTKSMTVNKGPSATSFSSAAHLLQSASHAGISRAIAITALHSDRHAVVAGYEDGGVEVTYYQLSDDGTAATVHRVITPTELDPDFHKTEDTASPAKATQSKEKETAAQRSNSNHPVVAVHGMQLEEDSYLLGVAYKDRVYVVVAPFEARSTAVTLHRRAAPQPVTFALTPSVLARLLLPPPSEGSSAAVEHVILSPCGQFVAVTVASDVPQVLVFALPLPREGNIAAAAAAAARQGAEDTPAIAPATVPLTGAHLRTRCVLPAFAAGGAQKGDPLHASCHFLLDDDDTAGMLVVAWAGTACYMRLLLRPSLARALPPTAGAAPDKAKGAEEPVPRGESRRGKEKESTNSSKRAGSSVHTTRKSEAEISVPAALAKETGTPLFVSARIHRAVVTSDHHYVVLGCTAGCVYVLDRHGVMAVAGGPPPSLPLPPYGEAPKTEVTALTAAVGRRHARSGDGGEAVVVEEVRIGLGATHTRQNVEYHTATFLTVTAEDPRGTACHLVGLSTAPTAIAAPTSLPLVVLSFGVVTLLWDVQYNAVVGGLPMIVHRLSDLSDDGDNLLWVEGGATILDSDARPSRWPLQALLRGVYPLLSTHFPQAPLEDLGAVLRRAAPALRTTAALGKVELEETASELSEGRWSSGGYGCQGRERYVQQRLAELQAGASERRAWLEQLLA